MIAPRLAALLTRQAVEALVLKRPDVVVPGVVEAIGLKPRLDPMLEGSQPSRIAAC